MEYFTREKLGNFYLGLNQVQAFALFGFDGVILWYLFRDLGRETIGAYSSAVKDVIDGFSLLIVYLACEMTDSAMYRCFHPGSRTEGDLDHIISRAGVIAANFG